MTNITHCRLLLPWLVRDAMESCVHTRKHAYTHKQTQATGCIDISKHHMRKLRIRVVTLTYVIHEISTSSAFILGFSLEKCESSRMSRRFCWRIASFILPRFFHLSDIKIWNVELTDQSATSKYKGLIISRHRNYCCTSLQHSLLS